MAVNVVILPTNRSQEQQQSVLDENALLFTSDETPVLETTTQGVVRTRESILKKRRNLLLELNLRKRAQLTPKAAKLYKIASEYRHVAKKLQSDVESNKEKLQTIIQQVENGAVFGDRINNATFRFIRSQILRQKKAPRGRRYSREDKIFAMSLLKHGGKSYKFLKTIFALPSRKTLMSMLSKIPFGCGIQQPIFDSLKESIKNLKPIDRHCVLMFDEMSLQPSLHYIKNT